MSPSMGLQRGIRDLYSSPIKINQLNGIDSPHKMPCIFCKTVHPSDMEIIEHVFKHLLKGQLAKKIGISSAHVHVRVMGQ